MPGVRPERERSRRVNEGESLTRRTRPRIGDEDGLEFEEGAGATGSSRMQTAASEIKARIRYQIRQLSKEVGGRNF